VAALAGADHGRLSSDLAQPAIHGLSGSGSKLPITEREFQNGGAALPTTCRTSTSPDQRIIKVLVLHNGNTTSVP
jgi:hypothetical protein